ncbi:PIN/TRAM domain-containing protein [Aerococcus kribbianus]|uniref:PIN domain nuclease n=1 Tax=Aerococcus kribbianus TaxID=2999064 RepID=A0A9X3JDX7_9LACT|nr:PIN domain nuclease [Aerococcus sp. YH-aer222]MCZ0726253.1 PIN domain nuclease [Aerococcus sp. YH-aer222]
MSRKNETRLFRLLFMLVGASMGYYLLPIFWRFLGQDQGLINNAIVNLILGALIFYILFELLKGWMQGLFSNLVDQIKQLSLGKLLTSILGLILGLILAWLANIPIIGFNVPFISNVLPFVLTVVLGFIGYYIGSSRSEEIQAFFTRLPRLVANEENDEIKENGQEINPDQASSNNELALVNTSTSTNPDAVFQVYKILDTSVIIDGRILDVIRAGFVEGIILVPNFVLKELQYIADSADSVKRVRGRRGLDVLNKLQTENHLPVEFTDSDFDQEEDVDLKLLLLARQVNGVVVTNDYNLNKVSQLHQIKVLNLNELANALKMVVIPGERMTVRIIKVGTERQQGVAYLDDGTMVVVEDGKHHMDENLEVEITSSIQTNAGKMIFAKIV